jgi:hypothetical protein
MEPTEDENRFFCSRCGVDFSLNKLGKPEPAKPTKATMERLRRKAVALEQAKSGINLSPQKLNPRYVAGKERALIVTAVICLCVGAALFPFSLGKIGSSATAFKLEGCAWFLVAALLSPFISIGVGAILKVINAGQPETILDESKKQANEDRIKDLDDQIEQLKKIAQETMRKL